jgi:hypothetical protein
MLTHPCLKWFSPVKPHLSGALAFGTELGTDAPPGRRARSKEALSPCETRATQFTMVRSEAGTEYATLGRFREDQPRLEATAAAHGRGNQGQATADLLHHTVDDGEPETSARANR